MENLKSRYLDFQKKYALPTYEDLDRESELLCMPGVAEITKPLAFVRRRIVEKIEGACNMLQTLLHPIPGSYISIYEGDLFTKEEREKMMGLLRSLMVLERESLELDLVCDERGDAAFITKIFSLWGGYKTELLSFVVALKKGWKEEKKTHRSSTYLG